LYLIKLNNIVQKGTNLSEADKADLQDSLDKAVKSAQLAIAFNKSNYLNHRMLGSVYETVIPLGVAGSYDGAVAAYKEAGNLNPLNPSLKLILTRVSLAASKIEDAKNYANQALVLKSDYVDALVFLAQIAKNEGNTTSAINYAEKALKIAPSNKDLIRYVNSLKGISGN
jgi:cytochrome c-type biogenesis protein CcmH/NrfG